MEADYLGLASGKNVNKFEISKLTPLRAETVDAPYVKKFPVVMECRLKETVNLGSHTMFIGEVMDLNADEDVLTSINLKSGHKLTKIDMGKVLPFIFDISLRSYYKLGEKIGEGVF